MRQKITSRHFYGTAIFMAPQFAPEIFFGRAFAGAFPEGMFYDRPSMVICQIKVNPTKSRTCRVTLNLHTRNTRQSWVYSTPPFPRHEGHPPEQHGEPGGVRPRRHGHGRRAPLGPLRVPGRQLSNILMLSVYISD